MYIYDFVKDSLDGLKGVFEGINMSFWKEDTSKLTNMWLVFTAFFGGNIIFKALKSKWTFDKKG